MLSAGEKRAIIATIPWVDLLEPPSDLRCVGIKWNRVALRDLFVWGPHSDPQPPRGIQERARCSLAAKWRFHALRPHLTCYNTNISALDVCIHHLVDFMHGEVDEHCRLMDWGKQYHPELFGEGGDDGA